MRKVLAASLLVALVIAAGCLRQPQTPATPAEKQAIAGPQIYENNAQKDVGLEAAALGYTYYSSPLFLLYYPNGWTAEEPAAGVFAFTEPLEETERRVSDQLIVEIWAGEEATPEAYAAYEAGLLREGDRVTRQEKISFKGRDAFAIEIEGTDEGTGAPLFFRTIYFRNGQWVYRLQYSMEQSRREKSEPLFKDLLDKFVVGDY